MVTPTTRLSGLYIQLLVNYFGGFSRFLRFLPTWHLNFGKKWAHLDKARVDQNFFHYFKDIMNNLYPDYCNDFPPTL